MQQPWVHIIGAGVSGLTLGASLARLGRLPGDVIISDPRLDQARSQTFCFWFDESSEALLQPERAWSSWSFSRDSSQSDPSPVITHRGSRYRYGLVSGEGFRERALTLIKRHPQIHLRAAAVSQAPKAGHVFDSRPPRFDNYRVKQSFVGLEVELTQPHHLKTIELMHDLCVIDEGLQFRYVLPLDERRLLVEYTRFTKYETELDELDALGRAWLSRVWGDFTLQRVERAHIPMGLKRSPESWGIAMGARACMTRDSTGYGFAEMHAWSERTARALIHGEAPRAYTPPIFRAWMDSCLLRLIEERAELLPEIFLGFGERLPPDRFAGFMTTCPLNDALAMMFKAPKRPFLLAALGQTRWI